MKYPRPYGRGNVSCAARFNCISPQVYAIHHRTYPRGILAKSKIKKVNAEIS